MNKLNVSHDDLSVSRTCIICNASYVAKRVDAKFCSNACKQTNKRAVKKLTRIAAELNWSLDDLLDWYQHDMGDIAGRTINAVRFIVSDYIENHTACRATELPPVKSDEPNELPDYWT